MIIFTTLLALILRTINIGQSFWLDEAITVYAVKTYNLTTLVGSYLTGDFHPPLYFVLLWFWTRVFGFGEIAVRMLTVVLGVLTVVLVWLIGKRINRTVGLGASFLLAISGYHIYYSQEARMYVLGALLGTLSYYFLLLNLENRDKNPWANAHGIFEPLCAPPAVIDSASSTTLRSWFSLSWYKRFYWFGYFLATLGAIYTDYLLFFLLISQVLLVLVKKKDFDFLKKYFFVLLCLFVFYLPWLPTVFRQITQSMVISQAFPVWGDIVGGATLKNLFLVFVKFTIGRISFENKLFYAGFVLVFFGAVVFCAAYGVIKDWRLAKKYVYWFGIPLILAFLFSFVLSVFAPFRLIFLLPPFYLLVGLGLWKMPKKLQFRTLSLLIVFSIYSLSLYFSNIRFQREDWRGASYFLSEKVGNRDLVVVLDEVSWPILLYQKKRLPVVYYDKWEKGDNDTIWLVRYAQPIFEPDDRTRRRIEESGYKKEMEKDFNGVVIYAYRY